MKKGLFALVASMCCGAVVSQPSEYYFSYKQKRMTDYLKAIEVKTDPATGVTTKTLVPGTVTTGARIIKGADGSCREEYTWLLRLDRIETPDGAIQLPVIQGNFNPMTCPVSN